MVSRATGLSRKAISHGIKEMQEKGGTSEGRIRRKGGGRKTTVSKDPSPVPPGTSKWNKIKHCLFAWISQNRRGQPLTSYAVILKLIAAATTEAGLTVQCQLDTNPYPAGRKVSDEEMASLSLLPDTFHGEWNSTIRPRTAQIDAILL